MARHLYAEKAVCMNTTLKNTGEIGNRRKGSLMRKLKSISFAFVFGLLTAFTLAGSIWASLFTAGPNSITRLNVIPSDNIPAHLIAGLSIYLCGGRLWGLEIAGLMSADAKSMVKVCAPSWSATVVTIVGAISFWGMSLGGLSRINILPHFRHSTHYHFLLIFVPVVGIITAINGSVVANKLGFHERKKSVGLYTGVAAALGFLAVGLILLFGLGWEVGRPIYGKYGMLLLLLICNIGAALAGGTTIGWMLERSRIRLDG
jgi:hypothetical protein